MEETKTENSTKPQSYKLAIWSLVLGIVGAVLCVLLIPSLLAGIFGIIAIVRISQSKGLLIGMGKAIAGVILSGVGLFLFFGAIIVPNLLTGNMSSYEASAVSCLKYLPNAESLWFHQDVDGNGIKDYWTYDVSCFHLALRSDNTKISFIPLDLARADANPVKPGIFGDKYFRIIDLTEVTPTPKSGYLFRAMELDEKGHPYNQELVNGVPATNKSEFAFVAYPEVYAYSGINTFIVNEEGTIYANDTGNDANKIILTWPGVNPTGVEGPNGRFWRVAD